MAKGWLGGKYGKNDAGIHHWLDEHGWGQDREFIGSGYRSYRFLKPSGGVLIIRADSWKDAQQIARAFGAKQLRGYSKDFYKS